MLYYQQYKNMIHSIKSFFLWLSRVWNHSKTSSFQFSSELEFAVYRLCRASKRARSRWKWIVSRGLEPVWHKTIVIIGSKWLLKIEFHELHHDSFKLNYFEMCLLDVQYSSGDIFSKFGLIRKFKTIYLKNHDFLVPYVKKTVLTKKRQMLHQILFFSGF